MIGPDLGGHEHLAAFDAGGAHALADLALVLINLRGIDVTIAESQCLLDDAGTSAATQLPGAEPDRRDFCTVGLDILHARAPHLLIALCRAQAVLPIRIKARAPTSGFGEGREHGFGRVRDNRKQRPRRSPRYAFALLPIADGLDRHAKPCRKFLLRQTRAAPEVAHFRGSAFHSCRKGIRRERELLPVP